MLLVKYAVTPAYLEQLKQMIQATTDQTVINLKKHWKLDKNTQGPPYV